MILGVKTLKSPFVKKFYLNSSVKIRKGLKAENLHLGAKLKFFELKESMILVYNYKLLGGDILKYLAFFISALIIVFKGLTLWLLLPLIIYNFELSAVFLGYWLMFKGLRKVGYKDKIKILSKKDIIDEVV